MASKRTTLKGTVQLIGKEPELKKVFRDLVQPARNKVNKRTGVSYTIVLDPQYSDGRNSKGTRRRKLEFVFERRDLLNNTVNNFENHIQRAIDRSGFDIEVKVNADENQVQG